VFLTDISIARIEFPIDWTQAHGTGSARWMAPELIDPKDYDGDGYPVTSQTDIYAFGMTVLEVGITIFWIELRSCSLKTFLLLLILRSLQAVRHFYIVATRLASFTMYAMVGAHLGLPIQN
jgi:serine/threonine protein kinase